MYMCSICETKPGVYKCNYCSRIVCERDYVFSKEICRVCFEALCEICNKYLSINKCSICGRKCCEDCSVQITLVQYVCIECYKRQKGREI